jgi:type IV pilus assembly protein PilB
MANLNIAEQRLPQDGHFRLASNPTIDIRINCCPILNGEKIVLRLLKGSSSTLNLHQLGLNKIQIDLFRKNLQKQQGLIIVTGPTGCGKTLTLYSALNYLNQIDKNISSIEEPVEINLPGINQVNINPKIGFNFITALRTLLRQDPDIIMIGEMRDREITSMAVEAAQTGHLVLSTLHANSALQTLIRLQTLGIKNNHFIHSLTLIIAQRLVRKFCNECKKPISFVENSATPTFRTTYKAEGCHYCHEGYRGRTGIFELLPITSQLAQLVIEQCSVNELAAYTKQLGVISLWESGKEKIKAGITSLTELTRVVDENII